jgi:hypothetical protein
MRTSSFVVATAAVLASKPAAAAVLASVPEPAGLTMMGLAAAAGFIVYQVRKRR